MRRRHWFEIHELPGCPAIVRRLATDYLTAIGRLFRAFDPVVPLVERITKETSATRIVDLCAGAGGPSVFVATELARRGGPKLEVVLTDLYPNPHAEAQRSEHVTVRAEPSAVDARAVPAELSGIRTLFDAFHHFEEPAARKILADAASSRAPLLIVEGTERSWPGVLSLLLIAPLLTLLLTPLVRPRTPWRFLLTYVVPLAPLLIAFDGVVSCLRTYTPQELERMTQGLAPDYRWEVGRLRGKGPPLTYLLGVPTAPGAR
jgi:hypothetical protein